MKVEVSQVDEKDVVLLEDDEVDEVVLVVVEVAEDVTVLALSNGW